MAVPKGLSNVAVDVNSDLPITFKAVPLAASVCMPIPEAVLTTTPLPLVSLSIVIPVPTVCENPAELLNCEVPITARPMSVSKPVFSALSAMPPEFALAWTPTP